MPSGTLTKTMKGTKATYAHTTPIYPSRVSDAGLLKAGRNTHLDSMDDIRELIRGQIPKVTDVRHEVVGGPQTHDVVEDSRHHSVPDRSAQRARDSNEGHDRRDLVWEHADGVDGHYSHVRRPDEMGYVMLGGNSLQRSRNPAPAPASAIMP